MTRVLRVIIMYAIVGCSVALEDSSGAATAELLLLLLRSSFQVDL
jgi:hypothetical protein